VRTAVDGGGISGQRPSVVVASGPKRLKRSSVRRFAYRLALATGEVNVDRLLRKLTWPQLQEWMEYDAEIEPIGARRSDWQAASICTAFANVTLATRGARKRFRMKDFLLEFDRQEKEVKEEAQAETGQSWQQMKFIAQMWAAAYNADENKKKKPKREWRR
jgi:hypothetical protein